MPLFVLTLERDSLVPMNNTLNFISAGNNSLVTNFTLPN